MADISKITLPSNVTYDVKDTTARSGLANKQDKITAITAQTTQAVYPIKIDSQGHITAYGSAVTIPAAVSTTQKVYTGSCDTLHTALEKVVTLHDATGFNLTAGVVIIIYFEHMSGTFSGTSAISLNVNNTGSKTVYRGEVEVKNSYSDLGGWNDKSIVGFAYDGSHWNRFYSMDNNTTYLAMTESDAKAGTVVNAMVISPSVLATAIDYRLPTKTSQLTNDSGFLTSHQDISGKVDKINITAQNTQAVYPIKINAQGQISAYGSAVTIPAAVAVKGNSESTYRTGNVNLTAANIGAAAASHTHSANDLTAGYVNIHPENSPVIIPFMHNDIGHLLRRGGSASVTKDGAAWSVDINNCFDGTGSYWAINPTGITTIVIELTLHKTFGWTNTIYVDFGSGSWRSKSIKIEVMNTNYSGDTWTQKYSTTTNSIGHIYVTTSHTPTGASDAGGGFNKIRLTFSSWQTATGFRISQIGVYNYGSLGLRETYMSRGVDDYVFRNITPNTNNAYSLGSSSLKWKDIYSGTLNGTTIPASPKFTDTTYGADRGISNVSGNFGHSNTAITAQNTQALYPIKIDAYGHITGYGSAVEFLPPKVYTGYCSAKTNNKFRSFLYENSSSSYAQSENVYSEGTILFLRMGIPSTYTGDGYSGQVAIDVNNFSGALIYSRGVQLKTSDDPAAVGWRSGEVIALLSKGSYFELIFKDSDTNTTYSSMTQSEAITGTSTTGRLISAKVLSDTITDKIGAEVAFDELWTNGTEANFASQLVNIDLRQYDFVLIMFSYGTELSGVSSVLCKPNGTTYRLINGGARKDYRDATVTTSGVEFGSGIKVGTYGDTNGNSNNNSLIIPRAIYGIKKFIVKQQNYSLPELVTKGDVTDPTISPSGSSSSAHFHYALSADKKFGVLNGNMIVKGVGGTSTREYVHTGVYVEPKPSEQKIIYGTVSGYVNYTSLSHANYITVETTGELCVSFKASTNSTSFNVNTGFVRWEDFY